MSLYAAISRRLAVFVRASNRSQADSGSLLWAEAPQPETLAPTRASAEIATADRREDRRRPTLIYADAHSGGPSEHRHHRRRRYLECTPPYRARRRDSLAKANARVDYWTRRLEPKRVGNHR